MRLYDISQLPVLEDGRVVGIVDEWDLIRHVQGDRQRFSLPVSEAMSRHVETLDKRAPESELQAILDRGLVAVIADNTRFLAGHPQRCIDRRVTESHNKEFLCHLSTP